MRMVPSRRPTSRRPARAAPRPTGRRAAARRRPTSTGRPRCDRWSRPSSRSRVLTCWATSGGMDGGQIGRQQPGQRAERDGAAGGGGHDPGDRAAPAAGPRRGGQQGLADAGLAGDQHAAGEAQAVQGAIEFVLARDQGCRSAHPSSEGPTGAPPPADRYGPHRAVCGQDQANAAPRRAVEQRAALPVPSSSAAASSSCGARGWCAADRAAGPARSRPHRCGAKPAGRAA